LVQAVKRNAERFPGDFLFQLTLEEAAVLRSQSVISKPMSLYIVRAFVKMREDQAANAAILKRLAEIDKTLLLHDHALRDIYQKLRPLLEPPPSPSKPPIGFHVKENAAPYRIARRSLKPKNAIRKS